jgi:hypothetical protein
VLAAFDAPIFGGNRKRVFATYLSEFSERAFVAHDRVGQNCWLLNSPTFYPWSLAATTPEFAEALLAAALSFRSTVSPRDVFRYQHAAPLYLSAS